jgi:hypothetical protein
MGFIDVTTLTSAFTGAKIVNKDSIDSINGNFLMFFIIVIFKGCYNITLCNNITFISQVIK